MQRIDELSKEKCCGCTACLSICPVGAVSMVSDVQGFLYPQIDEEKCVHCGLCGKVCIGNGFDGNKGYLEVYGIKHKDDDVRKNSTSGGAFTAFSDVILGRGGVVYGVVYDDAIVAKFIRVDNKDDRDRCRGSKYVQAEVRDIFSDVRQDLLDDKEVLFVGTPCQVAGLKSFLQKDFDNLYVMDFVCHGVVSPKIFADHIKMLAQRYGKRVAGYNNRFKVDGWGIHTEAVMFENGDKEYRSCYSQAYKHLFHSLVALRPSCYQCSFCNLKRQGDLTVADMWGIDKCLPDFKDFLGVSLVLVHNSKGLTLFDKAADKLVKKEPLSKAWIQPNMQFPSAKGDNYDEFWEYYLQNGYEETIRKYAGCGSDDRL